MGQGVSDGLHKRNGNSEYFATRRLDMTIEQVLFMLWIRGKLMV
jgi:hypothetical protein